MTSWAELQTWPDYVRAKAVVDQFLGDIRELPLIFEPRMLCPNCLLRDTLVMAGASLYCGFCSASYRGTVYYGKHQQRYLRLNDGRTGWQ